MTLKDDLTDIPQIGPARAEEIIDVFDAYAVGIPDDEIDAAINAAKRGNEGDVIAFLESLR